MRPEIGSALLKINSQEEFEKLALEIFQYQAAKNPVYKEFLATLDADPSSMKSTGDIPHLPVELFKNHRVYCSDSEPELIFESSGTTGQETSRHYVAKAGLYRTSFTGCFEQFYGDPEDMCILALLPSYLERAGSSLVYMMNSLIQTSYHPDSGFYLDNLAELASVLQKRSIDNVPTLLLGVSFALLDLVDQFPMELSGNIIVMETGGMKGRREEMIRTDLHNRLKEGFKLQKIHSEYGMTELLSQAYSKGDGIFQCPPWMQISIRDGYDPLSGIAAGQTGGVNIIDLANIYSCSFIATSDLGKLLPDGSFEIVGRFDYSDIRGCNLMV